MSKLVFVTGATGAVGQELVQLLIGQGYQVRVLVRPTSTVVLPPGVERVVGTLADTRALKQGVRGVAWVFHLAALLHINDPGPETMRRYTDVNVTGTGHLVEASRATGVERFVFFSTINVYGPTPAGELIEETVEPNPQTEYATTKLAAEQLALTLPGATVLRLAAVYGPHMKGNYRLLAKALSRGVRVMVGTGLNRRSLVHVEDVAQAALQVALSPETSGEIFNVTDGSVHTFDRIVRAMQVAMGMTPNIWYVPAGPVKAGLSIVRVAAAALGRRFSGPLLVDKLTEDVAVSGDKLIRETGYKPAYSLARGWEAIFNTWKSGK